MLEDVQVKWCQFWVFWGPRISRFGHWTANTFLRGESVLMGRSLLCLWFCSHRREMMTQCERTPAVGVPLTKQGLSAALPENRNEEENEEKLRNMRENTGKWGNIPILPIRGERLATALPHFVVYDYITFF